jgi:hypothetical protein
MADFAISSLSAGQSGVTSPRGGAVRELTPEQQRQVTRLKEIDQNVRAHEAAHLRAGHGVVTSGASYTYTYGPDGKAYAVGGEVGVDTSAEAKPQANIDKGRRIQAAALAPSDPSPQDYRVAGVGAQLEARGRADLATGQGARNRVAAAYQPAETTGGTISEYA